MSAGEEITFHQRGAEITEKVGRKMGGATPIWYMRNDLMSFASLGGSYTFNTPLCPPCLCGEISIPGLFQRGGGFVERGLGGADDLAVQCEAVHLAGEAAMRHRDSGRGEPRGIGVALVA